MATGGGVSLVALLLPLAFILVSSSSIAAQSLRFNTHPQVLRSSEIRETTQGDQVGRGCSYTVKIKTSCSSPRFTRDAISIAFGDAYDNEVYAPRLDDPSSRIFEQCSTDTFKMQGPCGYGICYMYLRRIGRDGWIPDSVKVYDTYGETYTFNYGTRLPNNVWYGYNNCRRLSSSDSKTATAAHHISRKPNGAAVSS